MPTQPPPPKPPKGVTLQEWTDYLIEVKKYIKKLKKLQ